MRCSVTNLASGPSYKLRVREFAGIPISRNRICSLSANFLPPRQNAWNMRGNAPAAPSSLPIQNCASGSSISLAIGQSAQPARTSRATVSTGSQAARSQKQQFVNHTGVGTAPTGEPPRTTLVTPKRRLPGVAPAGHHPNSRSSGIIWRGLSR